MGQQRTILGLLLVLTLLLAACAEPAVGPEPGQQPAETVSPTPTLAPLSAEKATATAVATQTPTATPTIAPTPTQTPTPTPTPLLDERSTLAAAAARQGDRDEARSHLEALLASDSDSAEDARVYLELGGLHLADGNVTEAIEALTEALALDDTLTDAHFLLGEAHAANEACVEAVEQYKQFLEAQPELAGAVQPRIAACYDLLDEPEQALAALEAAAGADSHFLVLYSNRLALANRYTALDRFGDAADVYRAIQRAARTDRTRGEMHYYIGNAMLLDGNTGGFFEYQQAVNDYPTLYTSYLALVALIEAGIPVDEFQRGVVDYYAGAYQPGVEAFGRYLADNPDDYDTHLYLAWTYEQLGEIDRALEELDTYAGFSVTTAPIGLYERGLLLQRQGMLEDAVTTFRELAETIPQDENAPDAAWRAATLSELAGDTESAIALYRQVADVFPEFDRASEALFRAGLLAIDAQDAITALSAWEQAARLYPITEYGQASLLWLLTVAPEQGALPTDLDAQPATAWYYGLRVSDELDGVPPFTRQGAVSVGSSRDELAEAESWLREELGLAGEGPLMAVSAEWQSDPHTVRGELLWRLGLLSEAKQEFFELRRLYRDDPLAQYQMAVFFSELGVYSQSIGAAERLMALTGTDPFTAPSFIAKLAYPTYYADLILPLADEYGYDPLLQFALIRQESLYESFATSTAVAQGLAQVIPDTGQYIADKLGWPDYENADLYKPYVGLRFGGFYLAEQLNLFDGAAHAALAAYNAGPGNALNWYAQAGDDIDAYVETVNFAETRLYIERIYTGYAIYRSLYGMQPTQG